jgi:hypothetical protein
MSCLRAWQELPLIYPIHIEDKQGPKQEAFARDFPSQIRKG